MSELNDLVIGALIAVFELPGAALLLALCLLLFCALILFGICRRRFEPVKRALAARRRVLDTVMPPEMDDPAAQDALAERFVDTVDPAMRASGRCTDEVRRAWAEYKETIVDPAERPLRNTVRPEVFFLHIGDDLRVLGWWANLFVAMGLVLTFLGLVAALGRATGAIDAGANAAGMQAAIADLLRISSAKFFTSIAGVAASIALRIFERRWRMQLRRSVTAICDQLERGLKYVPPQSFAANQLVQLTEQTTALKLFNTELASAIGEQFERRMQPMVTVLGSIESTLQAVKDGGFAQISEGMSEALSKTAGREMTALSDALTQMTQQFGSVHQRIEAGGDAAGQRIAEAAEQFALASSGMTAAFGELGARVDGMAARLTEQSETASRTASERLDYVLNGVQEAAGRTAFIMDQTAEKNAAVFGQAAGALNQAAADAAGSMQRATEAALADAASRSGAALNGVLAEFRESFATETRSMSSAVSDASTRMLRLAQLLDESAKTAGAQTASMSETARSAQAVSAAMSKAAGDLERAAAPVQAATHNVADAVEQLRGALASAADASEAAPAESRQLAGQTAATSQAAERAWAEYRARFDGVDQALGETLRQITDAVRANADHLSEHVIRIDKGLGEAVTKLAGQLDPVSDLAAALEEEMELRRGGRVNGGDPAAAAQAG